MARSSPRHCPDERHVTQAGDVSLRLIYTEPYAATMLRVDLLVAAMARSRLWIADAYFIGHGPYVMALQQAVQDGVDVRLLLPAGSDVGWTVPVSRTLYRTLLASGVRVFEWNGSMMHAKTAVADSQWARIGSTNANLNSWVGNWELDVAIEDRGVAQTLEAHYEEDLAQSTEILAARRTRRAAPGKEQERVPSGVTHAAPGSSLRTRRLARRALRTASGVGHSMTAAVTGSRQLEAWESAPLMTMGAMALAIAVVAVWWPRALAWPIGAIAVWIGLSFLAQAVGLFRERRAR